MAPFLRDEGPPVSQQSIQRARESLPLEYGNQLVNETGREVLLVRVPKAKPDYLHDLADVAFYVSLDMIKATKDVLLVGHEKCARLEPQQLRDYIRAQQREDAGVVDAIRRSVDRQYGVTTVQSPSNHTHFAVAMRIPRDSVAEITPDDITSLRAVLSNARKAVEASQYAYIVANRDHERLGRRVLLDLLGMTPPPAAPAAVAEASATPVVAPAATPTPMPVIAFPRSPSGASQPAPAMPAAVASSPFSSLGIMAPAPAVVAAAPMPVATLPAPVEAPTPDPEPVAAPAPPAPPSKEIHDEYEIVSKPKAPVAHKPAPAPLGLAADPSSSHETHEEYEIVSKPKAKEPSPLDAAPVEHHDPDKKVIHASEEFEVFTSKPKPREKPTITPPGQGGFMAAFDQAAAAAPKKSKEYSIMDGSSSASRSTPPPAMSSRLPTASAPPAPGSFAEKIMAAAHKPAPLAQAPAPVTPAAPTVAFPHLTAPPAAAIAPQPMATSAQSATAHPQTFHGSPGASAPGSVINLAALGITPSAPAAPAPAPAMQAAPASFVLPHLSHAVLAAPAPAPVTDDPRIVAPRVAPTPSPDNGMTVVPLVAPVAPEIVLAGRFKEAGYEVVEGLKAQGHVFAFAAHKQGGRRVLVKRAGEFTTEDAATLAQLVTALGADVALVVAEKPATGVRLATWGTRIEVVTPDAVSGLLF